MHGFLKVDWSGLLAGSRRRGSGFAYLCGFADISERAFHVPRYPCIPEAMAVANDDEWDDETYARQQAMAAAFA